VYYLNLEFINEYGEAVTASWTDSKKDYTVDVPPKGESFVENAVTAFNSPAPVYIEATMDANNESVLVNGQKIFPVVYTEFVHKNQIRFGEGKNFEQF